MAITRAQQARQLYIKGGQVFPDGRRGFGGGADMGTVSTYDSSKGTGRKAGPGTGGYQGGPKGGSGGGDGSVTGDDYRRARREYEIGVSGGKADIEKFKKNRPEINLPNFSYLNFFKNPIQKFADFTAAKNRPFFEDVIRAGKLKGVNFATVSDMSQDELEQAYKDYMSERLAGNIDAYGNPLMSGDDDPFIPINQMSTNMDQAPEEEVLSPIQQAILDRGDASAFLATGGRVGLKGGADASQFDKSPSEQKSVDISPSGSVTLGSGPPEGPDDRGSDRQNTVQTLVNLGYTPKEIRRITEGPNVIDRIKESRLNNPLTRGIVRTGLYTLNPTLGPIDFRKAMQLKGVYDTTMENIYGDVDMDDITLGATELSTKGGILNDPFMEKQVIERITQAENDYMRKTGNLPPEFMGDRIRMNMYKGAMQGFKGPGFAEGGPVGGIMDLESGRQMYFLGKLVKKATRAVKKIVKSPIGKAALFAAPFLMNPAVRTGIGSFLRDKAAPFLFKDTSGSFMDMLKGGLTGKGSLALGGALTLAPLLFQEDTNEDEYQKFLAQRSVGGQLPASIADIRNNYRQYMGTAFLADGGRPEPVAKKTMPLLDMDGKEKDYRETGGFVDMGRMERADDVPARLSKNEFVFTADAVRNAGEGDIDKGAEVMYNMMKNLEAGGEVSEESQGLDGARKMFQTSQRLEEVL